MRPLPVASIAVVLLAGCAAPPATPPQAEREPATLASGRCSDAPTGSRIPQCNRGDVKVITREELERNPPTGGSVRSDPDMPTLPRR